MAISAKVCTVRHPFSFGLRHAVRQFGEGGAVGALRRAAHLGGGFFAGRRTNAVTLSVELRGETSATPNARAPSSRASSRSA